MDRRNFMFNAAPLFLLYGAGEKCLTHGLNTLQFRQCAGQFEHMLYPSLGTCGRCGRPWATVEGHVTKYDGEGGCFPLCEACWQEMTPAARLPFYRALYERWLADTAKWKDPAMRAEIAKLKSRWPLIQSAVLAGK